MDPSDGFLSLEGLDIAAGLRLASAPLAALRSLLRLLRSPTAALLPGDLCATRDLADIANLSEELAHAARSRLGQPTASPWHASDAVLVTSAAVVQTLTLLRDAQDALRAASDEQTRLIELLDSKGVHALQITPKIADEEAVVRAPGDEPLYEALRSQFGHSRFLPGQLEAIRSIVIEQRDTVYLASTGTGKSLPLLLPASTPAWLASRRIALCFCASRSIVEDRTRSANEQLGAGAAIALIGSGEAARPADVELHVDLEPNMKHPATRALLSEGSTVRAIFMPFEMLTGTDAVPASKDVRNLVLALLRLERIGMFAVDEADMIASCGLEAGSSLDAFRPALGQLGAELDALVNVANATRGGGSGPELTRPPVLAVTATLAPTAMPAVMASLMISSGCKVVAAPLQRVNLRLGVRFIEPATRSSDRQQVVDYIMMLCTQVLLRPAHREGKVLVYFHAVHELVATAGLFGDQRADNGLSQLLPPLVVHAKLTAEQRSAAERRYMKASTGLLPVFTTDVIGRGMHTHDVRAVVHVGPPVNVSQWQQRNSRCARAPGARGECHMLITRGGVAAAYRWASRRSAGPEQFVDVLGLACGRSDCLHAATLTLLGDLHGRQPTLGIFCCDSCASRAQGQLLEYDVTDALHSIVVACRELEDGKAAAGLPTMTELIHRAAGVLVPCDHGAPRADWAWRLVLLAVARRYLALGCREETQGTNDAILCVSASGAHSEELMREVRSQAGRRVLLHLSPDDELDGGLCLGQLPAGVSLRKPQTTTCETQSLLA